MQQTNPGAPRCNVDHRGRTPGRKQERKRKKTAREARLPARTFPARFPASQNNDTTKRRNLKREQTPPRLACICSFVAATRFHHNTKTKQKIEPGKLLLSRQMRLASLEKTPEEGNTRPLLLVCSFEPLHSGRRPTLKQKQPNPLKNAQQLAFSINAPILGSQLNQKTSRNQKKTVRVCSELQPAPETFGVSD